MTSPTTYTASTKHRTSEDRCGINATLDLRVIDFDRVPADDLGHKLRIGSVVKQEAKHNVFLHDPLTVATHAYRGIAAFEPVRVSAFRNSGACRMVEYPHGRLIDAYRSVDNRAIADLIVPTLTSRTDA